MAPWNVPKSLALMSVTHIPRSVNKDVTFQDVKLRNVTNKVSALPGGKNGHFSTGENGPFFFTCDTFAIIKGSWETSDKPVKHRGFPPLTSAGYDCAPCSKEVACLFFSNGANGTKDLPEPPWARPKRQRGWPLQIHQLENKKLLYHQFITLATWQNIWMYLSTGAVSTWRFFEWPIQHAWRFFSTVDDVHDVV